MNNLKSKQKGETLILLLVIMFVFSLVATPLISSIVLKSRVLTSTVSKEQALQIAEAGITYYQWHLAHYPTDYQDGTGVAGPYVHNYLDFDTATVVGTYSLTITPPATGSTIVTITSTGVANSNPGVSRTITAKYGIPSLAKYSFLSNGIIWIGNTESVSGQMQSNNGIRFDGTGNAPIQSAKTTYTCGSGQGCSPSSTKNGVWGSAAQSTKNYWQFPVPMVDFSSLTSDLAGMKSSAQSAGIYLPPSNSSGYSLVFKSNGTIDIYKVTALKNTPIGYDVNNVAHNEHVDYKTRSLQFNKPIPANGIVYIEDKTWVEGTVNGRVIVAAATLPYNASTAPTIYIPNNIVYAAKDGTSALGLLAQQDIVVTYYAPTDLEVDAALVAQNGSAQFFYWSGNVKNSITVFGATMSFGQWTWSWVDNWNNIISGYTHTYSNYDGNLLYGPPPSFPLSASGYQQISWTSN